MDEKDYTQISVTNLIYLTQARNKTIAKVEVNYTTILTLFTDNTFALTYSTINDDLVFTDKEMTLSTWECIVDDFKILEGQPYEFK